MDGKIHTFAVYGLHGHRNYVLEFVDNTLILVGENGTGKTTALRLFFYLLSNQWSLLTKYRFDRLAVTIGDSKIELEYDLIEKSLAGVDRHVLRNLPLHVRRELARRGDLSLPELHRLAGRMGVSPNFLMEQPDLFDEFELFSDPSSKARKDSQKAFGKIKGLIEAVRKALNSQILYLPTYRRIEEELDLVFRGVDKDEWHRARSRELRDRDSDQNYVELIEFGMQDVDRAIKRTLEGLKDFARENMNTLTLGYLGDVVDQEYDKVDADAVRRTTVATIDDVLGRLHDGILTAKQKTHLSQTLKVVRDGGELDAHSRVICHYFLKLLKFQEELRAKEKQMTTFCDICNRYLVDKTFKYDSANFNLFVQSENFSGDESGLQLRDLSSGEKQIVSLFSHLYLSGGKQFFVLIDEPELSLSVTWQREFLVDIKNGEFCSGLMAVTHSPFIYDNELRDYARGLGEFEV